MIIIASSHKYADLQQKLKDKSILMIILYGR